MGAVPRRPELNPIAHEIGKLLVDARLASKMTQKQVAKQCGVHHSLISQYEKGQTTPPLHRLMMVCNALVIDPGEIVGIVNRKVFRKEWRADQ